MKPDFYKKNLFNYILFFIACTGLSLTGYMFLQDPNVPTILGFLLSIAAIIRDYLIHRKSLLPFGIDKKNKQELYEFVDTHRYKINIVDNKGKMLSQLKKQIIRDKYRWNFFKHGLLLISVLAILFLNSRFPYQKNLVPSYALGFYEFIDGQIQLVHPDSLKFVVNHTELINNEVHIPLQIALRNNEHEPLKIVKVVITYPRSIKVRSSAKALIDPTSNTIVYEHNFETLQPIKEFTPIRTIDTLIIPFKFHMANVIAFTGDKIPMNIFVIYDQALYKNTVINFNVDIYCEGRPAIHGKIWPRIKPGITTIVDMPKGSGVSVSKEDIAIFENRMKGYSILDEWMAYCIKEKIYIKYIKKQRKDTVMQYVYLENVLRRVTVDTNNDSIIDFVLINSDHDVRPNQRFNGDGRTLMYDWDSSKVN